MSHTTDKQLLNRLKRANGHLAKIIGMIEANRDGMEIAQQMQAVISALENAKVVLIRDHIEHHLEDIVGELGPEARDKLGRLSELARFL